MRFAELHLARFGHFTDKSLNFPAGSGDLHIIFGPNEAGKSTTLRAVRDLLFGIPDRTDDDFLHSYKTMKLGGVVEFVSGQSIQLSRVKGRENTLRDGSGELLGERHFSAQLGGISRSTYTALFGLDHRELLAGSQSLLANRGALGETLFGAGLGGADISAVRRSLTGAAEAIYLPSPRARKRLNVALGKLRTANQQVTELALRPQAWHEERALLDQTIAVIAERDREHARMGAEISRFRRISGVRPLLLQRNRLTQELASHGRPRPVPAGVNERWLQMQEQSRHLIETRAQLLAERARREQDCAALIIRADLLELAPRLRELQIALPLYQQAIEELPEITLQRAQLEAQITALNAQLELSDSLGLALADVPVPSAIVQAEVRDLARTGEKLVADRVAVREQIAVLDSELEAQTNALSSLPEIGDGEALGDALAKTTQAGDSETRIKQLEAQAAALRERTDRALCSLGYTKGSLEQFSQLALPLLASLDQFQELFSALERDTAQLDRQIDALQLQLTQTQEKLSELHQRGELPSADALAEARSSRDQYGQQLRDKGVQVPLENWVHYAALVLAADQLADALFANADRVITHAQLTGQVAAQQQQLVEAQQMRAQLIEDTAVTRTRWQALWEPSGVTVLTPAEMKEWWHTAQQIRAEFESYRAIVAEVKQLKSTLRSVDRQLVDVLVASAGFDSGPVENAPPALGEHRRLAERLVARWQQTHAERDAIGSQRAVALQKRAKLTAQRQTLSDSLRQWRTRWGHALKPLGLSGSCSAAQAAAVLDVLGQAGAKRSALTALDARYDQVNERCERFTNTIRALCVEAAPELIETAPEIAAHTLLDAFGAAERAAVTQAEYARRIADIDAELAALDRRRSQAAAQLALLIAEIGATDPAEIDATLATAAEVSRINLSLLALDEKLAVIGAGLDVATLERESAQFERDNPDVEFDMLVAMIEQMESQSAVLRDQLDALHVSRGEQQARLDAMNGDDDAAQAAAESHSALAEIKSDTEEYLRLRVAELLLTGEMKRYQQRYQGPIVDHAGRLFEDMTDHRYRGLLADIDADGETQLRALNAAGDSIAIAGLSDGTRDQLYLSLRLASILQYGKNNESLPIVIDDLLINFDDQRSSAAIAILADVARDHQVLFFTHHEHLLSLALNVADGVHIHRLD